MKTVKAWAVVKDGRIVRHFGLLAVYPPLNDGSSPIVVYGKEKVVRVEIRPVTPTRRKGRSR